MAAADPIILTAPPLFARQFLFDDRFLKWCDGNQVKLDVADAKRDLFGTKQIDAIRFGSEPGPDLISTPVFGVQWILAAAPTIAAHARPSDRSWWLEQTLLSPGVSDIAWPQVWRALKVGPPETAHPVHFSSYAAALEAACAGHGVLLAPLPFSGLEFASARLSRLSNICLSSRLGYSLLMRRKLADSSRGRALRRRIIGEIKQAKRF
jgi:DNA-binding transcriptional LysR family regulator